MEPRYGLYDTSPIWSSFPQSQRHRIPPTGKITSWIMPTYASKKKSSDPAFAQAGCSAKRKAEKESRKGKQKRKADKNVCVCLRTPRKPRRECILHLRLQRESGERTRSEAKKSDDKTRTAGRKGKDFCTNGQHFEGHHRLYRRDHSYLPSHVILNEWEQCRKRTAKKREQCRK